ncbi:MarR family winged helix-turn-helix transcriptional regulator [Nocardia altamirensis]|uniref:MarR family winged helix-turn-helix transcriptional regulator n=1 Tax=Nocardia altamirensis TaxID=472158 RepID=UPI000A002C88|nr:MarR family transcriptional regulator [Nocardia altamirensis]
MPQDSIDRMVDEWAARDARLDVSALQVIGRLFRCAAHGQQAVLDALAPLGLSYADFDVLNTLRRRNEPGGTNPRDLAHAALITSGAMTTRLDRLDRMGFIERQPDPDDRRAVRIHLTKAGEKIAARALAAVLAADEDFLEPLGPKQRDALAASLKVLLLHSEGADRTS